MFYVYVLKSKKDNKLYIGYTKDLKKRIQIHNSGKNFSTAQRGPFSLVYYTLNHPFPKGVCFYKLENPSDLTKYMSKVNKVVFQAV